MKHYETLLKIKKIQHIAMLLFSITSISAITIPTHIQIGDNLYVSDSYSVTTQPLCPNTRGGSNNCIAFEEFIAQRISRSQQIEMLNGFSIQALNDNFQYYEVSTLVPFKPNNTVSVFTGKDSPDAIIKTDEAGNVRLIHYADRSAVECSLGDVSSDNYQTLTCFTTQFLHERTDIVLLFTYEISRAFEKYWQTNNILSIVDVNKKPLISNVTSLSYKFRLEH